MAAWRRQGRSKAKDEGERSRSWIRGIRARVWYARHAASVDTLACLGRL